MVSICSPRRYSAYFLSEAVSLDNRWSPAVAETLRDMYTSRHVFVRTGYNFSCGSAHVFGSVSLGVLLLACKVGLYPGRHPDVDRSTYVEGKYDTPRALVCTLRCINVARAFYVQKKVKENVRQIVSDP
jgi:hypothetical protein